MAANPNSASAPSVAKRAASLMAALIGEKFSHQEALMLVAAMFTGTENPRK